MKPFCCRVFGMQGFVRKILPERSEVWRFSGKPEGHDLAAKNTKRHLRINYGLSGSGKFSSFISLIYEAAHEYRMI